jgi:hypothetical protein
LSDSEEGSLQAKAAPWTAKALLAATALQGAATFVWYVRMPGSPEAAIMGLGLSPRQILMPVVLAATIASVLLAVRAWKDGEWASNVGGRLFQDAPTIPRLLLYTLLLIVGGLCAAVYFWPQEVLETSHQTVQQLIPIALWAALSVGELGACWLWTAARGRVHVSSRQCDMSVGLLLLVISLAARAPMTAYGLPYSNVWDEVVTYSQAMKMLTEPGLDKISDVPGYGPNAYGDLLVYVAAVGETAGLLDAFRTDQVSTIEEYVSPPKGAQSIFEAVHPSGIPLRYPRLLLAFITSLAPVIIYLLLRKHFGVSPLLAFGSGLIYAVFSRDVLYYSSYILPDSLAATIFLMVLLASFDGIADEADRLSPWLASAVFAGMTLSVTVRDFPVVIVPFVAFALARNHDRPYAKLTVLFLGVVAGFAMTSPYAILDLPSFMAKVTSFTWAQDWTIVHRLKSLIYYSRGMFAQGFDSGYVDTSEGSVGLGGLVGLLALVGAGWGTLRHPRKIALIAAFSLVHLSSISAVVRWYTRHALVLYPLACVLAGLGMSFIAEKARAWLTGVRRGALAAWARLMPILVLVVFLVLSSQQLRLTLRYIQRTMEFEPSQVRVAEYLQQTLAPGDKVGILDQIPWVNADLVRRGISFERVDASDKLADLRRQGFTYVVGSDRFGGDYWSLTGNVWGNYYATPGAKLAEFGNMPLQFQGYPSGSLYLFVGRIPGAAP